MGSTPFFGVSANSKGSGKSRLVDVASIIVNGANQNVSYRNVAGSGNVDGMTQTFLITGGGASARRRPAPAPGRNPVPRGHAKSARGAAFPAGDSRLDMGLSLIDGRGGVVPLRPLSFDSSQRPMHVC